MTNASSVHGLVPAHGITSATAVTLNPPFQEFTVAEKEEEVPSRCVAATALDIPLDLFEPIVSVGVVELPTTMRVLYVLVVEKFRHLRWRRPQR